MKKLIALLLTIAMVLSLTACGGETMLSAGLSVNIKGSGKKEMKVSVIDQFEDLDYELKYVVDTNEEPVYQVVLTKDEEHTQSYSVTGCKAGTASWTIQYVIGDQVYAAITMDITVNEALHVFYSNLSFSDVRQVETIALLDEEGNEVTKAYISVEVTGYKLIQLENDGGWWNIGEYDESILRVTQKEIEDDDTSSTFMVEAIGIGTTFLYFLNPDIDTQIVFDITTKANEETGGYILIVNDYKCSPMEYVTTEETVGILGEIEAEFGKTQIPSNAYIKGAGYTSGTEGFADIEFMVNRDLLMYTIIKGETAASLENYTTSQIEVIKEQKIRIGTYDAKYCYLEGGVCIIFWDEEGQAIRLSFDEMGKDSEDYEDWLDKYMPPVYDTNTSDAAVKAGN